MRMRTKSVVEADRIVGQRIHALRRAKGISQTHLGRAVGVTFQQVQKYERGTNRVSAARLRRIADLLEMPVSAFFDSTGAAPVEGGDSILPFLQLPGAGDLLRAYPGLSPDLRRCVLVLARDLARAAPAHSPEPELVS